MSRIANYPVELPAGVDVGLTGQDITVKGKNGTLTMQIHNSVEVKQDDKVLTFAARGGEQNSDAMAGTVRALINNMVKGVSDGFEKKLQLNGVFRIRLIMKCRAVSTLRHPVRRRLS